MDKPAPTERLLQLDGLRGAAILCVIWHHYGLHLPGWLDIGPIAPSIFFLLSGYLITRSLLKQSPSIPQLAAYHARRFTRLLPALYFMLAVGWLVGRTEFRDHLAWHAGFLTNILMVSSGEWAAGLSHLWSLAVQEQFYLLWPLILLLPSRWLPFSFALMYLGAAAFRAWCLHAGTSDFFRWFMLPSSLDAFAAGALIAWAMLKNGDRPLITPRWKWAASAVAAGCWLISRKLRYLEGTHHVGIAFIEFFETITLAFLLIVLLQNVWGWATWIFSRGPLVAVGKISYGIYVWHVLVWYAFTPLLDAAGLTMARYEILHVLALTLLSIGIATISWVALERPLAAWSRRLTAPDGALDVARGRIARFFSGT